MGSGRWSARKANILNWKLADLQAYSHFKIPKGILTFCVQRASTYLNEDSDNLMCYLLQEGLLQEGSQGLKGAASITVQGLQSAKGWTSERQNYGSKCLAQASVSAMIDVDVKSQYSGGNYINCLSLTGDASVSQEMHQAVSTTKGEVDLDARSSSKSFVASHIWGKSKMSHFWGRNQYRSCLIQERALIKDPNDISKLMLKNGKVTDL